MKGQLTMKIARRARGLSRAAGVALALGWLASTGCEDDDGGGGGLGDGHDFGDNDPNKVVALGDSITHGYLAGVTPYPAILGSMIGKNVINAGVPGNKSSDGLSRTGSLLSRHQPGYMIILLGSNDAIHDQPTETTINNLRAIAGAAQANKTIPILSTLPPMTGPHAAFQGNVDSLNRDIPTLAKELGVRCVRLDSAVKPGGLSSDGLHPNQAGQQQIATAYANVF
jgi:lysophospholipase L1-like esterase